MVAVVLAALAFAGTAIMLGFMVDLHDKMLADFAADVAVRAAFEARYQKDQAWMRVELEKRQINLAGRRFD